ncbi:MAG: M20/M25/M40 family metallo-hydrolase [Deltaproteobacteria bacterium]|nr:M20/M25/M40 family metallo-hydrolase [Deltaproteobacteria bacterium]
MNEPWRAVDPGRVEHLLEAALRVEGPSGAEGPTVDLFEAALRSIGAPVRRQPVTPGRSNLLVRLGARPARIALVGHLDTIDPEEPREVRREGDLLWGLGAADMRSGCVAMVEALRCLLAAGLPGEDQGGVLLALLVGEEESGDGAEALLRAGELDAPLTVIGEPTSLLPCPGHYGFLELTLVGQGTRAHAAVPEEGANAIHATVDWVREILRLTSTIEGAGVNVRRISGGGELFVVADGCEAVLDLHLPPGIDDGPLRARIEEARRRVLADHPGCSLEESEVFWAGGWPTSEGDARLEVLRQALAALGRPPELGAFRSHSDGPVLFEAGTLPVICGPGALEVAHRPDEHVSLSETVEAARLYAALLAG